MKGTRKPVSVGSRLELEFAKMSKANLLSEAAREAAEERIRNPEKHQTLREDRLWADLLSSMPLCFNLFGELAVNAPIAARTVRAWWPDAPEGPVRVRFEHSPGRWNGRFLNNKTAFDVAFEIALSDGTFGVIGVETKYHEHAAPERRPKDRSLELYASVTESSDAFVPDWRTRSSVRTCSRFGSTTSSSCPCSRSDRLRRDGHGASPSWSIPK